MMDKALEEAYRQTIYRAGFLEGVVEIRVGERSDKLEERLRLSGDDLWTLITAYNPRSEVCSADQNEDRDIQLEARLLKLGYPLVRTTAVDPEGNWPDESGFLVVGMTLSEGESVARDFDQNAILFGRTGFPVHLHFVNRKCDCEWTIRD
jgi:Protein of unknown function (DUF3293)